MQLAALCAQVEQTVRQAAQIMNETFTMQQKDSPSNIVTSADIGVQRYLQQALCALLPDSGFFGEEDDGELRGREYLWIVDPIDGTANFSRGIPECAISVGLVRNGQAVLGVVYNPYRQELFSAVRGQGARCNTKPIRVSQRSFREGLLCTALSLYRKEYAPQCMAVIAETYSQCNDVRRFGSAALELCYLAQGRCELYFEYRVFPWDYAGAMVILEEAGGIIRGARDSLLTFDRTTPLVAANTAENYERLSAIVKKHIPQFPYKEILI